MYKSSYLLSADYLFCDTPRSFSVNTFSTYRTHFILSFPNVYQRLSAFQRLLHSVGFSPFVVRLIGWVIGIGIVANLDELFMVNGW